MVTSWNRRSPETDDSPAVESVAKAADELGRRLRAAAVEHAAHQGRADDDAVRCGGHANSLLGGGDAEPHDDRLVGERLQALGQYRRALRDRRPLAGDAHEVDA